MIRYGHQIERGVLNMRTLSDVIRDAIAEFAAEQLPLIREGTPAAREQLMMRIEEFQDCVYEFREEVIMVLIKEGIKAGETMKLAPLLSEALDMQLLNAVDIEEDIDWQNRKSPFITDDENLLELMIMTNFNTMARPVAWSDGKKKYFMSATPAAAALASGNLKVYKMLEDKCPFFGDIPGFNDGFDLFDKNVSCGSCYKFDDLRLRSSVEAGMLANDKDCLIAGLKSVAADDELMGWGTDCKGDMEYYNFFKNPLPDAAYWMDEECSRYLEGWYMSIINALDIDRILETANSVFLERWMEQYDTLPQELTDDMIRRVKTVKVPVVTPDMVWDMARLKGVHCVPCSQEWLDERIDKCVFVINKFKNGGIGIC